MIGRMSAGEKIAKAQSKINRRVFVQAGGLAASGLVLGATLGCSEDDAPVGAASGDPIRFNIYVQIAPDDTVTLINPCAEMGQGVDTAIPQILADELDARWDQLCVVRATLDPAYNNPGMGMPMQSTAASTSIRYYYQPLREAGAAARDMLVRAAAARWDVAPEYCETTDGKVVNVRSGDALSYGALAEEAANLELPSPPKLKSPEQFKFIGRSLPSPRVADKSDGTLEFTIDVALPGMLYAAVKQSPVYGGRVKSVAEGAARTMPGVRAIVPMDNAVAVVAVGWWQAKSALDEMRIEFEGGDEPNMSSDDIYDSFIEAAESDRGADYKVAGDVEQVNAAAPNVKRGTFFMPFLAHMAMEPLSCTVRLDTDACEIWTGTQNMTRSTTKVAELLGLSTEQVTVHTPYLGGSFGRRLGQDLEVRAVQITQAAGAPVNVIWSREESTTHDYYRPAVAASYRATLDEQGKPEALDLRFVAPAFLPVKDDEADPNVMNGLDETPYNIPNIRFAHVKRNYAAPLGTWRSVQRSYAIFFVESIIDELAQDAKQDPYEYRRDLLIEKPRLRAVLDLAAEKSNWRMPAQTGRARGIALWPCYGSFIAQVVELSVERGKVKLHRVVNAVDCGRVVNPDLVRQQIEGGLFQGLTAALKNQVTIKNGAVLESNFHDYPMMTLEEMPEVETHFIDSEAEPGGVGELATPAVQAALTNAIFAATGKRLRTLPVSNHDLSSG